MASIGNIIAGTTENGEPRKVLVDDRGRQMISDDSPPEAMMLALNSAILSELRKIRLGMEIMTKSKLLDPGQ